MSRAKCRNSSTRRFDFSGGTCIHPGLVVPLNEAFTPKLSAVCGAERRLKGR